MYAYISEFQIIDIFTLDSDKSKKSVASILVNSAWYNEPSI